LASRISYYLYRCDKYKALLQLINCIEAREREQDQYRPPPPPPPPAPQPLLPGEFISHVATITKLYALLFQLKNTLGRVPPSAVSVTYATSGSDNFNVGIDEGTVAKINAYSQRQGALRAAVPGVDAEGKKFIPLVKKKGKADARFSLDDLGGRRRTRRKNGRRRTQKKRKTYV
jgi:hypothetical protein